MIQFLFYHNRVFDTGDHFHASASGLADLNLNVEHPLNFIPRSLKHDVHQAFAFVCQSLIEP
jgi:hypothetical protein